jgi:predicted Zn finger-like uncharacterized protein
MLTECSFCRATAKIPEDELGAKVRCSECGKVYVARTQESRVAKGLVNPLRLSIGGGAVVVIALFAWAYNRNASKPQPRPPAVVKQPEVGVDSVGWDSEIVRVVRGIYAASLALNEDALTHALDGARIAKRMAESKQEAALDFAALDAVGKQTFLQNVAREMMRGTGENSAHLWKPVDGSVTRFGPLDVTVRVTTDRRLEPGSTAIAESRTYDWQLARADEKSKWKAWSWERYRSPDEIRALKAANSHELTKVTLEDGTSLFQAELRHVDDYPDTTPEVHAQVEKALGIMLDFKLPPKESNLARDELVAIGRPAIPQLLSKFCDIKLAGSDDDPALLQVNVVHDTLKRITGYDSGFTALPGQSAERRTLALKAYFAWWERKGKNFTAPTAGKDLEVEPIVPTQRADHEVEKDKAENGGG